MGRSRRCQKALPPSLISLCGDCQVGQKSWGDRFEWRGEGLKAPRQSDERGRAGRQRERWAIGENGWWWAPSSLPLPP